MTKHSPPAATPKTPAEHALIQRILIVLRIERRSVPDVARRLGVSESQARRMLYKMQDYGFASIVAYEKVGPNKTAIWGPGDVACEEIVIVRKPRKPAEEFDHTKRVACFGVWGI
jgi:DNA-binding Lrp family transcriptional regulator